MMPFEAMSGHKQRLGSWGERLVEVFLRDRGFTRCARNLRTPYGEIDLIMFEGETMVFIEVKTRSGKEFGLPEEAVTPSKREHLLRAIAWYLQQQGEMVESWRVDVAAVLRNPDGSHEIEYFEDALREQ